MENFKANNKIYWYIIILFSLFILVFFTRDQIYNLNFNLDLKSEKENELLSKREENSNLEDIQKKYLSEKDSLELYNIDFKEEEFFEYIFSYIEKRNQESEDAVYTIINSINFTQPQKNEMWFMESTVNLNMTFPNEDDLKSTINFLTSNISKYKIFIQSLSYEVKNPDTPLQITIPLKIFYK